MAKKGKKDKKDGGTQDKAGAGAFDAVEAVRAAVERTFSATAESAGSLRGPAQGLAGDLAVAANRLRDALEARVLGELRSLRSEVAELARRVSALEARARDADGAAAPGATPPVKASAADADAKRTASDQSAPKASAADADPKRTASDQSAPEADRPPSGPPDSDDASGGGARDASGGSADA